MQRTRKMTHRYNTRFQAAKATESKKSEPLNRETHVSMTVIFPIKTNASEVSSHDCTTDCEEKKKELETLKPLLDKGGLPTTSRREKIMIAIKMFHYYENHTHLLRHHSMLRKTTLNKIVEFRKSKEIEENELKNMHYCVSCKSAYDKKCTILGMMEVLMESCDRVYQIIQNF